jgi:hypothetical protein
MKTEIFIDSDGLKEIFRLMWESLFAERPGQWEHLLHRQAL